METFNTRYYPWYKAFVSMMAWLPIFFLYFNEGLTFREVILLESIYYISVVILEVPSGYFSDRIGRKKTLVISSLAFAASYLAFGFWRPDFVLFAIAQILLATGFSFMSGTDTAFHYESLVDKGMEREFPDREAKVQSWSSYAGGLAALLGGLLGSVQLSYGYIVSFVFMLPALFISARFSEPTNNSEASAALPLTQLKEIGRYFKSKELVWLFLFSVVLYALIHVPYEFYQPYLSLLEQNDFNIPLDAALYSGVLFAGTRFLGGAVAGQSIFLANKLGLKKLCLLALALQLGIIGILGTLLHPLLILLILLRSVSRSITTAPVNAEIAPRLAQQHRATYFSLQSLVSRLSFSVTLIILSFSIDYQVINEWATLATIFRMSVVGGLIISIPLLFMKSGVLFKKRFS